MLHERLTRKEELLRDYEKDLGKLRQAELLLREKDAVLQDLEVTSNEQMRPNQRISFRCRRANDQKMMKLSSFEIH